MGGVLALLAYLPAGAAADTYTVTRSDDPAPGACLPNDCSLREALDASNASTAVDDVVVVPASAAPYEANFENKGLSIEDQVVVLGAGANQVVVEGTDNDQVVDNGSPGVVLVGLTITGGAGGVQNGGEMTFRGVSIEGNERSDAGGGIQTNGPVTLESSFVGFNRGGATAGGGIQANDDVTIVNSTLAGNLSEGNSAINGNDPVTITSSTIVGNRSSGAIGAGVTGTPLTVRDSVFADNRNGIGLLNCFSFSAVQSLGGNVEDAASCAIGGGDRPNVDPRLGTLALHGGTTLLYDLLPGSPAIDFASQCPPFDQRGAARPQGAACDSGSYEFVPLVPPVVGPPPDTTVDLRLAKGKLILKRRVVRVRLTCLPSEVSPPCSGSVRLFPPSKAKPTVARRKGRLAGVAFRIGAGRTKKVALRLSRKEAQLMRSDRQARRVFVVVTANDAAGNARRIEKPRKIVPR
ncbi:MAG TPA: choice-of-anchor Q domain-containing protein [Solirubrobacterales bacterium]|nr:choice-of-anchor Q domain-containing protein [Solirubrobacterales bacterium]